MKVKLLVLFLGIVLLILFTAPTFAHSYNRKTSDNPYRYIAYAFYPFGIACEYLITRPIHWFVSQGEMPNLFGHNATPDDIFFEW